jgi:hypothetical protein
MLGRAKRVHIDKKSTTIIAERVVHSIFLFLDLDLGRAADADHRDATGKLGQTRSFLRS